MGANYTEIIILRKLVINTSFVDKGDSSFTKI